MIATLAPDDNPPTLPAAGTLYGLPELAEAVATATLLGEKHRALIAQLAAAL